MENALSGLVAYTEAMNRATAVGKSAPPVVMIYASGPPVVIVPVAANDSPEPPPGPVIALCVLKWREMNPDAPVSHVYFMSDAVQGVYSREDVPSSSADVTRQFYSGAPNTFECVSVNGVDAEGVLLVGQRRYARQGRTLVWDEPELREGDRTTVLGDIAGALLASMGLS